MKKKNLIKKFIGLFFILSFISINSNVIILIRAETTDEPIITDYFTYTYKSYDEGYYDDEYQGGFKLLDVYFDTNPNNMHIFNEEIPNVNYFEMIICDELNTERTGSFSMKFEFSDNNGSDWNFRYQKQMYVLNSPDKLSHLETNFVQGGDINWVKENAINFSDPNEDWGSPSGISNLKVEDPVLSYNSEGITQLNWGIKYKTILAKLNPSGTAIWNINSSFDVEHRFCFFLQNQSAHLKIGMEFSNFSLNSDMYGSYTENYNLTTQFGIIAIGPSGWAENWIIDNKTINTGESVRILNNATIDTNEISISRIEFSDNYTVNRNEINEEIKFLETEGYVTELKTLWYNQKFSNLNLTTLKTIEMDPEVITYYSRIGPMTKPPSNPSISINEGANITNSVLVNLNLFAEGSTEMCFRNETTGIWSSWETYDITKEKYLGGFENNTIYTIYVKFRNATGETTPFRDSILYLIPEEKSKDKYISGYPYELILISIFFVTGFILKLKNLKTRRSPETNGRRKSFNT